jgi:AraC-like DNA-binding protein
MSQLKSNKQSFDLNPKQPEFVLATTTYEKKYPLQQTIAHFYQFKSEATTMGVIPDACIDILFSMKDGQLITRIAGSRLEKGIADMDINSEYFGVRFMPGVNPVSKQLKLSEIMNREECFDELLTNTDDKKRFLDGMYKAATFEEKICLFLKFYESTQPCLSEDSYSLKSVIRNKIIQENGNIKLQDLAEFTGYTSRYLFKKINEDFGMNPNSLIRFLRFQKAISILLKNKEHVNCMDTLIQTGYYDQSHFIKEFKLLSGSTPNHYIEHLLKNSYDKRLHIK